VLKAIRENEPRAISLGYDADRYKLIAFILSATLAGLAGAVKAIVFQLASLTDVHWTMSGEVVLMTLLGGMGTIFGPVVGAFIIIALESYLAGFGEWVTVITGVIFVVCVLAFRRGIVGELAAWWPRARVGSRFCRSCCARPRASLPRLRPPLSSMPPAATAGRTVTTSCATLTARCAWPARSTTASAPDRSSSGATAARGSPTYRTTTACAT